MENLIVRILLKMTDQVVLPVKTQQLFRSFLQKHEYPKEIIIA